MVQIVRARDRLTPCTHRGGAAGTLPRNGHRRGYPAGSLSPQVIQCPLLPHGREVFPARLAVNQADDDGPHDRTPLFDLGALIPAIRCRVASRGKENGFVRAMNCFVVLARVKQVHGIAILLLAKRATHNAAKRNMIARRRCVSMLDAQIPSKEFVGPDRAKVRCPRG